MFTRRHPYLFSLLVMCAIAALTFVAASLLVAVVGGDDALSAYGPADAEKVGIVEVEGVIADSEKIVRTLKRFREDDDIRAIILRVDSPGGGIGPSQEISREVNKTAGKKKIITSMGSLAASGGYYVAAGTSGIMANPGTVTGSIGVIMGYTNFGNLLERVGLYPVVVKSGEYKDMGSPVREMSTQERALLQEVVDGMHSQFVRAVASGRGLTEEKVRAIADGRILTGEQALALDLVDRLGNMEDAIDWVAELAGIEGEVQLVYPREDKYTGLLSLMESASDLVFTRILHPEPRARALYTP